MINREQNYVDVEVVRDGKYYSINLIDGKGTRYPVAMKETEGEALYAAEVEKRSYGIENLKIQKS